jgi:hypothetical protein
MTLPIIRSRGIAAYCPDLVVDENTWTYFMSVAGYQSTVKGIIACVLEYQSATVAINGTYAYVNRASESYCVHYQKLPSGLFQGIILPKTALPNYQESKDNFLILAENMSLAKILFFDHLEQKTRIPLHRTWSDWLWRTFSDEEWLTPLETLIGGCKGFLVDIYEDDLKDAIATAIRNKTPEIIRCFEKGGAYEDEQSQRVSG